MWWSSLQRPRPTRRPDGGCTHVELEEVVARAADPLAVAPVASDAGLHAVALLAAHAHADGPPVVGALNAVAVLHPLTLGGDSRRFQAWMLQGLYHCLAAAEAAQAGRGFLVVDAHRQSARGVLRLAATSPDAALRRRATVALRRLGAAVNVDADVDELRARPINAMGDPIMARP